MSRVALLVLAATLLHVACSTEGGTTKTGATAGGGTGGSGGIPFGGHGTGATAGGAAGYGGGAGGCAVGTADCDGIEGNGCEVTLSTDPDHCGACNHGCEGDTCTDGICDAVDLAGEVTVTASLAVDATHVYGLGQLVLDGDWKHALWRVDKLAGGKPEVLAEPGDALDRPKLIAGGDSLLFTEGFSLKRASKTGGILEEISALAASFTADDESVLWHENTSSALLRKRAISGGAIIDYPVIENSVDGLANDNAYWYRGGPTISRFAKAAWAEQTVTSPPPLNWVFGMAISDGFLWYGASPNSSGDNTCTSTQGTLYRAPVSGGASQSFATGFSRLWQVAADSQYVWFSACQSGDTVQTWRMSTGGGAPIAVPNSFYGGGWGSFAIDDQYVYYTAGGRIMRRIKGF